MPDDLTVAAQSGLPIAAPAALDHPVRRAPKFRNTENPGETWVGRGRRPRWLKEHLAAGRRLDDFRVQD
jgi:DNA-binding protein H-NS